MARLPRLAVSGFVHHVLVRGNNGQSVFLDDEDRQLMVRLLAEQVRQWRIALHGWVLLPQQFQLLLTPQTDIGIPRFMQALGRGYASAFNRKHGRTGTLWEGRYRSVILQPETRLLDCMVWMDTQAVRSQLCEQAAAYEWGSARHHLGQGSQAFVQSHALYWSLGNTPFARQAAYAARLEQGLGQTQAQQWADHVSRGWVLGTPVFVDELQKLTPRRLSPGKPGRPRAAEA